jgi:mevalonate pyrophosphate decarboxylase
MHTEGAVPPIEQGNTVEFLHSGNNRMLVRFIATMNDHAATKDWPAHVESVERANVATGLTDSSAELAECAGHIVKLAVESN